MSSDSKKIVVLGAGVVGLTSALALLERGYCVSVVAKHMPGDYDAAEYASPLAGANWWSVADAGSREAHWDELTFGWLWRLATQAPAAGIHVQDSRIYRRGKDLDTAVAQWQNTLLSDEPWFRGLVPGFRRLRADELLAVGADGGTAFTSVCINVAVFLPYLVSQCLARGGTFRRATVAHVCEAAGLHASGQRAAVVVNCSGLMACRLGGVMDGKVVPVRGQIVVVRNEIPAMINASGTDGGPDEGTYLMMRAAGGGTVIGGSYQKGNWDTTPDPNMTQRMLKRAIEVCPQLVKPGQGVEGLDIVRVYAALRPLRIGGVRLEKEEIDGVTVVHNYGAGGFGFQASYGMAEYTARLVDEATAAKAKL